MTTIARLQGYLRTGNAGLLTDAEQAALADLLDGLAAPAAGYAVALPQRPSPALFIDRPRAEDFAAHRHGTITELIPRPTC